MNDHDKVREFLTENHAHMWTADVSKGLIVRCYIVNGITVHLSEFRSLDGKTYNGYQLLIDKCAGVVDMDGDTIQFLRELR